MNVHCQDQQQILIVDSSERHMSPGMRIKDQSLVKICRILPSQPQCGPTLSSVVAILTKIINMDDCTL